MDSSTFSASLNSNPLMLASKPAERLVPTHVVFTEDPIAAFRGLFFALVFNLVVVCAGAGVWAVWRFVR
jgi:hypothetical protein